MANKETKMRSITGRLVPNKLTAREDDYTCNVTYQANRSIRDICILAAEKSKFSASELESAYNDIHRTAEEELYNASTVEFGFTTNSLGVDGVFLGPKAQFDSSRNRVTLRSVPLAKYRPQLDRINVIVSGSEEAKPTVTVVTDVTTGSVNDVITAGGGLNGTGYRIKIAGEDEEVGYYFVSADKETRTKVPVASLLRNEPSNFTLIIPALPDGGYYLEIVTQYGGNSKQLLKVVRRNRFPYVLYVGKKPDEGNGGDVPGGV